ncbi:MAG: hypothetical protein EPN86_03400 [Nanoarchaeota archaeon]|nr:MAG: hypothetical protein EPN86_03400 [Nanoarchaeota archaeon]
MNNISKAGIGLVALIAASLSACGGGSPNTSNTPTVSPSPAASRSSITSSPREGNVNKEGYGKEISEAMQSLPEKYSDFTVHSGYLNDGINYFLVDAEKDGVRKLYLIGQSEPYGNFGVSLTMDLEQLTNGDQYYFRLYGFSNYCSLGFNCYNIGEESPQITIMKAHKPATEPLPSSYSMGPSLFDVTIFSRGGRELFHRNTDDVGGFLQVHYNASTGGPEVAEFIGVPNSQFPEAGRNTSGPKCIPSREITYMWNFGTGTIVPVSVVTGVDQVLLEKELYGSPRPLCSELN